MHDRRLPTAREFDELGVRPATAGAAKDREFFEALRTRASVASSVSERQTVGFGSGKFRRGFRTVASRKATSPGRTTRRPASCNRRLHGNFEDAGHLLGWETSSQ